MHNWIKEIKYIDFVGRTVVHRSKTYNNALFLRSAKQSLIMTFSTHTATSHAFSSTCLDLMKDRVHVVSKFISLFPFIPGRCSFFAYRPQYYWSPWNGASNDIYITTVFSILTDMEIREWRHILTLFLDYLPRYCFSVCTSNAIINQ